MLFCEKTYPAVASIPARRPRKAAISAVAPDRTRTRFLVLLTARFSGERLPSAAAAISVAGRLWRTAAAAILPDAAIFY